MANLKAIRLRIGSVKNTQKITKAMKMVAAARLRRAQQNIIDLRPYAKKTMEVLASVAAQSEGHDDLHPLLETRPIQKVLLLVITSDRGLAGAFNTNVNKNVWRVKTELEAEGKEVSMAVVGRKGREYLKRREANIRYTFTGVFEKLSIEKAGDIARAIVTEYEKSDLDAVYIIYNEFKSAISQKVQSDQLLPIVPADIPEGTPDFIYEPNREALLDRLLPMYVELEIYRALLESVASEHGARMTAMDNATRNASELVSKLTLVYNRARQAAITKELMEIIGGAEALKG